MCEPSDVANGEILFHSFLEIEVWVWGVTLLQVPTLTCAGIQGLLHDRVLRSSLVSAARRLPASRTISANRTTICSTWRANGQLQYECPFLKVGFLRWRRLHQRFKYHADVYRFPDVRNSGRKMQLEVSHFGDKSVRVGWELNLFRFSPLPDPHQFWIACNESDFFIVFTKKIKYLY